MRKRHYLALSEALRAACPPAIHPASLDGTMMAAAHRAQWHKDCAYVADALVRDNPRTFDRALFLANCGVTNP